MDSFSTLVRIQKYQNTMERHNMCTMTKTKNANMYDFISNFEEPRKEISPKRRILLT